MAPPVHRLQRAAFFFATYGALAALSLWFAYELRFAGPEVLSGVEGTAAEAYLYVQRPLVLLWLIPLKVLLLWAWGQFRGVFYYFRLPDALRMGVEVFHNFDAALDGAEVVMMLRLQSERMSGQFIPSPREYRHLYGLTAKRLALAAPGALVMHPGPMNRGVEIDSEVADMAGRSLITRQVEMGVAIRMACLDILTREARGQEGWA